MLNPRGRARCEPTNWRHRTQSFDADCAPSPMQHGRCVTVTRARSRVALLGGRSRARIESRPPYELRPGTGRRGPEHLWARFDAAVDQLNQAGAGDSLADVVAAYAAVSEAAGALADALEAAGE